MPYDSDLRTLLNIFDVTLLLLKLAHAPEEEPSAGENADEDELNSGRSRCGGRPLVARLWSGWWLVALRRR